VNATAPTLDGRRVQVLTRTVSIMGNATLIAWLAYLVISPTIGFQWIESWHNEQRAVQIVLLGWTAAAYLIIGLELLRTGAGNAWGFPAWLAVLLAIGVISSLRTQFVYAALAEVGLVALLATTALLVARIVSSDPERYARLACRFALLFCTAYVLGVATRYLAAFNLGRAIDLDVLILGYANPRFPSALHALLIPFVAATVATRSEPVWLRSAAAVVMSFVWAINLGLGTRGIWFAYALGLPAAVALLGWRQTARLAIAVGLSAAAGAALYLVFFKVGPVVAGLGSAVATPTDNLTTVTSREVLWEMSWQAIQSAPLLGIGPAQFAAMDNAVGAHPHNWILQLASEWGLIALVIVLAAIVRWIAKVHRSAPSKTVATTAPHLVLIVALAYGLVDGLLVMPVSQSAAALAIGLSLGMTSGGRSTSSRARFVPVSLTVAFASCSIPIVASFSISSLPDQDRSTTLFRREHPGAWVVPRFWEQGLLIPPASVNARARN
jgi:putative inorganic carbon (hco3(-)) transporter